MTLKNKTPEQRKEQLIRIINLLIERGQNNEKINSEYKKLLNYEFNR